MFVKDIRQQLQIQLAINKLVEKVDRSYTTSTTDPDFENIYDVFKKRLYWIAV